MQQELRPRIYVPFETTGRVRRAFADRGWFACSCDLLDTQLPCGPNEYHHIGDAFDLVDPDWLFGVGWDMMIAFPVCTFLSSSGLHWNKRRPGREQKTREAVEVVRRLLNQKIKRIAVENPVGKISTAIFPPTQIIQPHQFGHDASKQTCLWLKNLPPLKPTKLIAPRWVDGKPRWGNQTDSGQNKLTPGDDRAAERSETYQGIADAMGDQWGDPKLDHWRPMQADMFV